MVTGDVHLTPAGAGGGSGVGGRGPKREERGDHLQSDAGPFKTICGGYQDDFRVYLQLKRRETRVKNVTLKLCRVRKAGKALK